MTIALACVVGIFTIYSVIVELSTGELSINWWIVAVWLLASVLFALVGVALLPERVPQWAWRTAILGHGLGVWIGALAFMEGTPEAAPIVVTGACGLLSLTRAPFRARVARQATRDWIRAGRLTFVGLAALWLAGSAAAEGDDAIGLGAMIALATGGVIAFRTYRGRHDNGPRRVLRAVGIVLGFAFAIAMSVVTLMLAMTPTSRYRAEAATDTSPEALVTAGLLFIALLSVVAGYLGARMPSYSWLRTTGWPLWRTLITSALLTQGVLLLLMASMIESQGSSHAETPGWGAFGVIVSVAIALAFARQREAR